MYIVHLKPNQPESLPVRIDEGGGATKRASKTIYNIPSTYTGEKFGFINFEQLNPMGELWQILT